MASIVELDAELEITIELTAILETPVSLDAELETTVYLTGILDPS